MCAEIYEEGGMFQEIFAGWIGATRFFFEAITVGEYRCLPVQTGFTIPEDAINRSWESSAFVALGYAGHDPNAVRQSCDGWYWSVLPAILIGVTIRFAAIGAMHGFNRAQQTKKPLVYMMKKDSKIARDVMIYMVLLLGMFAVTTYTFMRVTDWEDPQPSREDLIEKFFDF